MKSTDPVKRPRAMRSNRADHVVGDAAGQTVGTGSSTAQGGDWLAEMSAGRQEGAAPQPEPGVPIATRSPGDRRRGRAVESKRGQQ